MPRQLTAPELEELGRQYCKQKNYQKALQAFTEAFQACTTPDIAYLDLRAAVYEKLEALQSALKDGKQMIRLNRKDVRGYLRTGRILQKMEGKSELALEIYNLGLRSVPEEDKSENLRLLRGMRDKLTRQIAPPRSVDPFAVLPAEIVDLIMGYLNFKQKVNCLRVSKHWNRFLDSQPSLWTELDLSLAKKPVNPAFVRKCVYRSKMRMHTARINRLRDETMVLKLTRACKGLETLEFLGSELSGKSILEPLKLCTKLQTLRLGESSVVTLDAVTQVLRHIPTLKCAEFEHIECSRMIADWKVDFPNLQQLKLCAGRTYTWDSRVLNLRTLCSRAPNMTSLSLHDWQLQSGDERFDFSNLSSLESLHLVSTPHGLFPVLPSSLRNLTLTGCSIPVTADELEVVMKQELPLLETLGYMDGPIWDGNADDDVFFERLLCWDEHGPILDRTKVAMLKQFTLSPCVLTYSSLASNVLDNWRLWQVQELKLEEVDIKHEEEFAEKLVDSFTHLIHLSLLRTCITGVGIKRIISGLRAKHLENPTAHPSPGLKRLDIDFCVNVSPDAVEWARKQGVEVAWRTWSSEGKRKGRKVRY